MEVAPHSANAMPEGFSKSARRFTADHSGDYREGLTRRPELIRSRHARPLSTEQRAPTLADDADYADLAERVARGVIVDVSE